MNNISKFDKVGDFGHFKESHKWVTDNSTGEYADEKEFNYMVVTATPDLSQGSKDLLFKLWADQSYGEWEQYLQDFPLTAQEKGHFSDLIKKGYIDVVVDGDETWVTLLQW